MKLCDRRGFLGVSAGLAALPASRVLASVEASGAASTQVRTRQGVLSGSLTGGARVFKGVPYAQPPVGPLRFRRAQPPLAWRGVRAAIAFGDAPVQPAPDPPGSASQILGADTGEDCLHLNVWAPAAPGPHPVLAWIHGGGNEGGAASDPLLDGARFAQAGLVCVTVGYRTGILGFLELGQALGPRYVESSANGLRDIAAALSWIHANIAAFGGDPRRVTLAGQSAGAKNVLSVASSPESAGLFDRVICESGADTVHDLRGAQHVAALALRAVGELGARPEDLLTMPPDLILAVQARVKAAFERPFPFRAVAGGAFLPERPTSAVRLGRLRGAPMLLGSNRDESIVFLDAAKVGAPLAQSELSNVEVGRGRAVFARYAAAYPQLSPTALRVRFLSAEEYRAPTLAIARAQAAQAGAPVYLYDFARAISAGPFRGWATHAAELPYVWNAVETPAATQMFGPAGPGDARMASEIHARWVAFVRGDAPDTPGAVAWPPFGQTGSVLQFDRDARLGVVDAAEERLWTD